MRNSEVVKAWAEGRAAKSSNGNLRSDGDDLYSYNMKIGRRVTRDGFTYRLVLDVRGEYRYSQRTSIHVGLAARYADKIVTPVITRSGWSSWREFPADDEIFPPEPETITIQPDDLVGNIIRFESGLMETEEEIVSFFQYLVNTGLAWTLQGSYGRSAASLIEAGLVQPA